MAKLKPPTNDLTANRKDTDRKKQSKKLSSPEKDLTSQSGLSTRTVDEMRSLVEEALVELEGILTAASAVSYASRDIARRDSIPIMDKQMNAMDFVLRGAVAAHNAIWSAVDCIIEEPRT